MEIRKNKRFFIVLAVAAVLLIGAVWLNIRFNSDSAEAKANEQAQDGGSQETMVNVFDDYFNSFRAKRSEVRAQEIEFLRSIINSENADPESLKDAQDRLMELVGNMEKEFTIESRIRGKGFLDAAATLKKDDASIVIGGTALTDEEVARILDIVISETGLPAAKITISLGS